MNDQTPNTDDLLADGLMTVAEAAVFLKIGKTTLYEMMDGGHLIYAKFGKARRIPKRALIDLASANLKGGWKQAG